MLKQQGCESSVNRGMQECYKHNTKQPVAC